MCPPGYLHSICGQATRRGLPKAGFAPGASALPEGCCVAMTSGWHALLDPPRFTGRDGEGRNHTPGFHGGTAELLRRERNVKGIAVDTLSLDTGQASSGALPVHYAWLGRGRRGVEAIAALDDLSPTGALLVVAGQKVRGEPADPAASSPSSEAVRVGEENTMRLEISR